jgi:hypothetical protein
MVGRAGPAQSLGAIMANAIASMVNGIDQPGCDIARTLFKVQY